MNLSPQWADWLRRYGYTAAHWSELGDADAEDSVISSYAWQHGWIVLTNDRDFGIELVTKGRSGPSVVQIRHRSLRVQDIGDSVAKRSR